MRRIQKIGVWSQGSGDRRLHTRLSPIPYLTSPVFFVLIIAGCQAQKTSTPYYEDLSSLRPKISLAEDKKKDSALILPPKEIDPAKKNINAKVDAILDSIDRFNLTRKFIDGYTIQIYSGQKKDAALETKVRLGEEGIGLTPNIQYQQPKFRVTVGKYYSRLEAQKDLLRLKRIFSSAILVPERIMIK